MAVSEWRLSLKLMDQPSLPKSVLQLPEAEPGDVPPGQYRVATLKQLVSVQLPDAIPDPELIGGLITTVNSVHLNTSCELLSKTQRTTIIICVLQSWCTVAGS